MRRFPAVIGILMIFAGVYSFLVYFDILWNGNFMNDFALWIVALVAAILLISIGPGVIAYAYASSYQSSFKTIAKQKQWQIIQMPVKCSECQNQISFRSLEWISDDEVRCPFCSNELEIRTSSTYL
jgi:cytochrome c-type biogenesis protein CcmH/NrfF